MMPAAQAAPNLVTNGSFETGDLTGWTANPVSFPMYASTVPVEDGVYSAQIAGYSYGPDTLSQTIGTSAGQAYLLSFWLWQDDGTPSGVSVTWDGNTVYSETDSAHGYIDISVVVDATGSDTLVFSAYNDPAYTYLDNVSLTATTVPEPASIALLLTALSGLGAAARFGRRPAKATA